MAKITGVLQLKHLKTTMDYLRSDFVALKAKMLDKAVKINGVDFDGAKDIEVGFPPSVVAEYEDSFSVKDGENRTKFKLTHTPTGKIKLFIDGLRYFNGNNKADELYTYHKGANTVIWTNTDESNEGFQLSDMTVVFEYSYSKNEKPNTAILKDYPDGGRMDAIYASSYKTMTALPDYYDTSKATSTANMFTGCENLEDVSELDTSNVENMNAMFSGCKKLKHIPDLNVEKVSSMSALFADCKSLAAAPKLENTGNVTSMESMFSECESLTSIPEMDTSKVEDMRLMFNNCKKLEKISWDIDMSSCVNGEGMFNGCVEISDIRFKNVPKDFDPLDTGLKKGQYTILSKREG